MIFRNLLRRRARTVLTLLGVTVGIAAIVALVALSKGIAANYVQATSRSAADVTLQAVQEEGQSIQIAAGFDESILEQLRRMPEVRSAAGMLYTMVQVPDAPIFIVYGYEPDQPGVRHFKVTEGTTLADARVTRGGKPLILGKLAADKLNKGVGDTIEIEGITFRIVGIYETGVALEDSGAVISLRDAQSLADMPHQVVYVGIQLYHPERVEEFKRRLKRILPPDVEIAGTQLGSQMLEMLEMFDIYAWGIAIIAALVGGVGMMNTMLMSVFERTREIGVLRAVGWSQKRVLSMILGEALMLSLLGGLLGLGIGAGLTYLVASLPAMAGLTQGKVPPRLALQALSAALVLGFVGGAYPAWLASRLAPVEALSYDGGTKRSGRLIRWGGMAFKNLLRQRTRTILTVVGVGIGVLSIAVVGSLGEGAMRMFNQIAATTEITAVEANQPDTSLSSIDERVLKQVQAMPEVAYVTGMVFAAVSTPKDPFMMIIGRARTDPALKERSLLEGHLINGPRQCLLGWRAAETQDKKVGDTMHALGTRFTVVGIIKADSPLEDNGMVIDLREAQRLLKKPRQVMVMQIKLRDPKQADEMIERLSQKYPKLMFARSAEFSENLPDMESTEQMIDSIYVIAAIVGAIALMNTMIMSVYERTREIGVLRAVGWGRLLVLRQMLAESVLLTLASGVWGVLASAGVMHLLRQVVRGVAPQMFVLTPDVVVRAVVFCVILGVLGGLYPAWRATRFSPVEALRYE